MGLIRQETKWLASRRRTGGFTLTELIVVITIVTLLMSLLLVGVMVARERSQRARIQADFQAIAVALEAYKQDFGDYPRVPELENPRSGYPTTPEKFPAIGGPMEIGAYLPNAQYIAGSEVLCWALVGPYDAGPTGHYTDAMKDGNANPKFPMFGYPAADIRPGDGADGSGFRLNPVEPGGDGVLGTADDVPARGQVYSPYLNMDRFKIARNKDYPRYFFIQDAFENPILYFPASLAKPSPTVHLADRLISPPPNQSYVPPLYDFRDNETAFWLSIDVDPAVPLSRFLVMLGDLNADGAINLGEQTPQTMPFLLWSAGPDGAFGPKDPTSKKDREGCDDVANLPF